jgi:putative component of membrane protein insertase Oxa1/YidC/SpoIIIJ protein YidD
MSTIAVAGIDLYRRYLSPLKGFRCAHHALHSQGSCSTYGRDVYATQPFLDATRLLRARFAACKRASQRLRNTAVWHANQSDYSTAEPEDEESRRRLNRKRDNWSTAGDCVTAPSDCVPMGRCASGAVDMLSGLDFCSCAM